ncbi:MAG TPA: antibiotic biosynthesis monooxygenase [Bacteroidales bacterium]|nr:antibiotic biosynthesis monooxygenase [Bacteroidales bacterium]
MTVTCVYVHVKPEMIDEFIKVTSANHMESVKEPGNFRFDFVQQADDPSKFMIFEAYETDEAAAAHKSTPHYFVWRDAVKDMMHEPRYGVKYNIIQPKKK